MLGFSLQKLLVLFSIIAAVWYGFKLLKRFEVERKRRAEMQGRQAPRRSWRDSVRRSGKAREARSSDNTEEMRPCPACGTYIPAGTVCSCGGTGRRNGKA